MSGKIWFITGASRGFGRIWAEGALARGDKVVAAALDIKAFYMGAAGCDWRDTKSSRMAVALKPRLLGDHQALQDALYQAELFRLARESRRLGTA